MSQRPKPKASSKANEGLPVTKTMPKRVDVPVKDVERAVLKTKP